MNTQFRVLIDGELIPSPTGETMEVVNPANSAVVGLAPKCTPAEIDRAVKAARRAAPAWGCLTNAERGVILHRLAQAIVDRKD